MFLILTEIASRPLKENCMIISEVSISSGVMQQGDAFQVGSIYAVKQIRKKKKDLCIKYCSNLYSTSLRHVNVLQVTV